MKLRVGFVCVVLAVACSGARAETDALPRHGVIGLAVGAADTSKPEDAATNPLTIKTVVPGGAGEAAGIQAGDIVREVDGASVKSSADFVRTISRHIAGDRVSIRLLRNGMDITKTATLKPRPMETSADADVLYRSVMVESARRRVIVTRPKAAGHYPAVLFMGGLGCYSLDGELMLKTGYGPFLNALVKKNFVTVRVEKTGEGDSEGPACTDLKATAELEAQGYVAALRAMKQYDFVDPGRIFVFAHSLGPLIGSLVLPQEPVRGMVAAETIGRSWFEYGLENIRRQAALLGEPLDQVDADVRVHEKCAHHFYVEHESAEAVAKLDPQCAEMIHSYAGMPYTFMQQIGDISLAKQWKQVDAPVLVIYGTSDPATSSDEGRYLVELINSFHPGRASYTEIPGMGHDFQQYDSQTEFLTRRKDTKPHPYDTQVVDTVINWLEQQLQS